MSIELNVTRLLREVRELSAARGSSFADIPDAKVLAVTKTQSTTAIRAALAAGIQAVAENRVQEAVSKHAELGAATEWHFIGHLQTNKVKQVVPFCSLIHSLDSETLGIEIAKSAEKNNKVQDVLLQINVSGEDTKFGIPPAKAIELARFVSSLEYIRLCGCMTIAPLCDDTEAARPIFRELFHIFQEIRSLNLPRARLEWLSMGMTNDYRVAIEEGANLVRIGTGIFGVRR